MAELSRQEQKEVVSDLTTLFNGLVNLFTKGPRKTPYYSQEGRLAELIKNISSEFATVVDFQTGSQLNSRAIRPNHLASTELAAIDIVQELHGKFDTDEPKAIAVLYRVMEDAAQKNNIPFNPTYKPKSTTPSA